MRCPTFSEPAQGASLHQFQYAAGSWSEKQKVITRSEATDLGATDARFIVTNRRGRGKMLYEKLYCQRGAART
jgi:Transposase DDE domain group 1